ncbi:class I SAM-dependent methyltransferase [Galbibacter sp. CMA-7]|uniref:Class I SAM-dependent methyltransferase n=1 Tax=Galbibacter pacificus TaxID=2996052 RepID=A0ABT6FP91_9FLAO|nr:class I SAM-dependent methyltransferase [Galbibacter pacificus]MDG3581608.1 class I SAM-dependent methyltransferase [Galbibacter pacificus]MDG3585086.1 class I SAM-dependent methyltransferase [Galbibacter pacificus]
MNKNILNTGIQLFITKNLNTDISSLLLKGVHLDGVSPKEVAQQIEAKKKTKKKLPTWFNSKQIYYPNKLNIEQTSSEETAQYKSKIIKGKTLVDITGGFGVDTYYFAKKFETVIHCEINKELAEIAAHNFKILNTKNIHAIHQNGVAFLEESKKHFDVIFLDPSRRDASKNKVFLLHDCEPDILKILPFLLKKSNLVLMKTSPLIDLSKSIEDLRHVKEIHIVAVNNEVKELLWLLGPNAGTDIQIKTVNMLNEGSQCLNFAWQEESANIATFSVPEKYLYEPNAAVLKSGAFNILTQKFAVSKLHPNTHLYTSNHKIDFPGRGFIIKEILPYNKKILKKALPGNKANITTRNFPESVAQIRKKTGIKDGGDIYLFFCTNFNNEKIVISAKKT